MKKKVLSATLLLCICFGATGCGAAAPEAVNASPAETTEAEMVSEEAAAEYSTPVASEESSLMPIDEWEEHWTEIMGGEEAKADYDAMQYDESAVKSKVDEVIKNSKSIAEEIEGIENIVNSLNGYRNEDLKQQDMNNASAFEPYAWETEMDSLLKRALEEADASKKESIQSEQDAWKAYFDRCFKVLEYDEGSWADMQNSVLNARFLRNRCYILAKTLSDIRGENYELPKRFFMENTYVGDDGMLDISEGMEGGSIAITVVNGKTESELLCYDPLINDNTIVFETTYTYDGEKINTNDGDKPIAGKITYGWDGATLTITESGDKDLPVGTTINFPTAM